MNRKQLLMKEHKQIFSQIRGGSKSYLNRQYYLIKLIIEDLLLLPSPLCSLSKLTQKDIKNLVALWQTKNKSLSTMLNKLAALRFLNKHLAFEEAIPSNIELGLKRAELSCWQGSVNLLECYKKLHFQTSKVIFGLSIFFGLTFDEAITLNPFLHVTEKGITIPRNIAFNSLERFIPCCSEEQGNLIKHFLIGEQKSLIEQWSRDVLLGLYKGELSMQSIPLKRYRFYYAAFRQAALSKQKIDRQSQYDILRSEMGLKNNVHLRSYLKNASLS